MAGVEFSSLRSDLSIAPQCTMIPSLRRPIRMTRGRGVGEQGTPYSVAMRCFPTKDW